MVKNEEYFVIQEMKQRGISITSIAKELGRDRKTIRRWIREGVPGDYRRTVEKPEKKSWLPSRLTSDNGWKKVASMRLSS